MKFLIIFLTALVAALLVAASPAAGKDNILPDNNKNKNNAAEVIDKIDGAAAAANKVSANALHNGRTTGIQFRGKNDPKGNPKDNPKYEAGKRKKPEAGNGSKTSLPVALAPPCSPISPGSPDTSKAPEKSTKDTKIIKSLKTGTPIDEFQSKLTRQLSWLAINNKGANRDSDDENAGGSSGHGGERFLKKQKSI